MWSDGAASTRQLQPLRPRLGEVDVRALEGLEVERRESDLIEILVVEESRFGAEAAVQQPLLHSHVEGAAPLRLQVRIPLREEGRPEGLEEVRLLDARAGAGPEGGGVDTISNAHRHRHPGHGLRPEAVVVLDPPAQGRVDAIGEHHPILEVDARSWCGWAREARPRASRSRRSRAPRRRRRSTGCAVPAWTSAWYPSGDAGGVVLEAEGIGEVGELERADQRRRPAARRGRSPPGSPTAARCGRVPTRRSWAARPRVCRR